LDSTTYNFLSFIPLQEIAQSAQNWQ